MTTRHIARKPFSGNRRVRPSGGAGLRPRARWWHTGVTVAIVTLMMASAWFGVLGSAQDASPAASPQASPQASPVMATPQAGGRPTTLYIAGEVTIEISDEGFSPSYFESAVGREITITLVNVGSRPHNFTMEDLDIDIDLDPGETATVTLDPPDLGYYPYTSDLPGDEDMSGTMSIFL